MNVPMNYTANSPIFYHWHPLFTVLLGIGCRTGEVIGLRWEDLDFENRLININHSVTSYAREGSKTRKSEFAVSLPKTEAGIWTVPMMEAVYNAFKFRIFPATIYGIPFVRGSAKRIEDSFYPLYYCNKKTSG